MNCLGISFELWSLQFCPSSAFFHKRRIYITFLVFFLLDDISKWDSIDAFKDNQYGTSTTLLPFVPALLFFEPCSQEMPLWLDGLVMCGLCQFLKEFCFQSIDIKSKSNPVLILCPMDAAFSFFNC
jgi:hypothetical protein